MNNLFALPQHGASSDNSETFLALLQGQNGLLVERIVSWGQVTPEGDWYDQERDEWVAVLVGSARIGYADGSEVALKQGDCLFVPRHVKHRVAYTSSPCVWLAVHGQKLECVERDVPQLCTIG